MTEPHPLDRLFEIIRARKDADPDASYTAKLIAQGPLRIAKKLGEEGVETALAAVAQPTDALISESADLIYHLLVLWMAKGIEPREVYAALETRMQKSGLAEKASRGG